MATEERDEGEGGLFDQDPFVEQMRPEPSAPPSEVVVLEGLAGRSDREGWARLYFNRMLTYYAEFRREDIVFTEDIPPEQAPMVGLKCTRVGIRKDAVIEYTRATRAKPRDEFDLDVRLAAGQPRATPRLLPPTPNTCNDPCITRDTCGITCDTCTCPTVCMGPFCVTIGDTCRTCDTCGGATCNTCQTQCNQQTCRATCRTCQTECAPCQTCPATQCQTQCNTCNTCQAPCPTHFGFTCNPFC